MRGYKTLMSFKEFLKSGLGPRYSGQRRTEDTRKGEGGSGQAGAAQKDSQGTERRTERGSIR